MDPRGKSLPPGPLVTDEDIREELRRLFDAGPDSGLVIRVYGESGEGAAAADAFREMFASLRMYEGMQQDQPLEILVDAPSKAHIARALSVLGHEQHQKRILDHILTTFGRRLIDPLAEILDTTPAGSVTARLTMLRDIFLAHIAELRMTPESQQILTSDLRRLMSDDYLAMVAENEERVQRPRVAKLAQQILRLVGSTFHRALRRWPAHAEQIASSIARRSPKKVRLSEVPRLIRGQITDGIEEFLWIETSADIEGALRPMLAEHQDVMPVTQTTLDRSTYREFADACWAIIAEHC
ncbi:MAG TPA: hypothetical protein VL242_49930 [Sorangium sp.]|uniref:hypothetical protein n=1 Tax=Sorangium sp. So ce1153 TaxID=3133333 RepID=UPI002BC3C1F6|nr:hypothetical protein [Sorangium sp.]